MAELGDVSSVLWPNKGSFIDSTGQLKIKMETENMERVAREFTSD